MNEYRFALFVSLLLVAGSLPERAHAGDVAYGEYLASECVTCHRVDGAETAIPNILGWDEASFVAIFDTYRTRERDNDVMQTIASGFDDEQVAALAAYFATLNPSPAN